MRGVQDCLRSLLRRSIRPRRENVPWIATSLLYRQHLANFQSAPPVSTAWIPSPAAAFRAGARRWSCGGAGSGKTLIGMEFLIRGIQQHGENGVFMSFEERATDLAENVASLGYDLTALIADKKLVIDQVQIDRGEIMETGEYDLEGLFIRLAPPSTRSAPSAWCWTPSRRCSPP